ncbi:MAG: biotin-dependent carboxyltransferase [Opitutae bacterium]|nr:biotin-dependent carboxyltransferase [Opitutae bacterium]
MSLTVLKPGLLTTVQDQGRPGWQRHGVVVGGAVDAFAARVANVVVGNAESAAVLEMALLGPELRVGQDMLVALCGAGFELMIGGRAAPHDRPVLVAAGETMAFAPTDRGARAWLAVAGGIDVPLVLGSRSTYVRGRLGGFEGRPLIAGDKVSVGPPPEWAKGLAGQMKARGRTTVPWSVRPETLGRSVGGATVRAIRGPEWSLFTELSHREFFGTDYAVTKDVDRMGMRLEGVPLALREPREEISSAVNVGVVQVPHSGQPIVLLVGRQTVGGYPRIAAVATVDLGKLAQFKPGDPIRFQEITVEQAHELQLGRERDFARVISGLSRLVA